MSSTLRDARLTRSWSSTDKVYPLLVDVRSGEANDETTAPSIDAVAADVAAADPTGTTFGFEAAMLAPDRVITPFRQSHSDGSVRSCPGCSTVC